MNVSGCESLEFLKGIAVLGCFLCAYFIAAHCAKMIFDKKEKEEKK